MRISDTRDGLSDVTSLEYYLDHATQQVVALENIFLSFWLQILILESDHAVESIKITLETKIFSRNCLKIYKEFSLKPYSNIWELDWVSRSSSPTHLLIHQLKYLLLKKKVDLCYPCVIFVFFSLSWEKFNRNVYQLHKYLCLFSHLNFVPQLLWLFSWCSVQTFSSCFLLQKHNFLINWSDQVSIISNTNLLSLWSYHYLQPWETSSLLHLLFLISPSYQNLMINLTSSTPSARKYHIIVGIRKKGFMSQTHWEIISLSRRGWHLLLGL